VALASPLRDFFDPHTSSRRCFPLLPPPPHPHASLRKLAPDAVLPRPLPHGVVELFGTRSFLFFSVVLLVIFFRWSALFLGSPASSPGSRLDISWRFLPGGWGRSPRGTLIFPLPGAITFPNPPSPVFAAFSAIPDVRHPRNPKGRTSGLKRFFLYVPIFFLDLLLVMALGERPFRFAGFLRAVQRARFMPGHLLRAPAFFGGPDRTLSRGISFEGYFFFSCPHGIRSPELHGRSSLHFFFPFPRVFDLFRPVRILDRK